MVAPPHPRTPPDPPRGEEPTVHRRILVVTTDPLTTRMPGPAIRAWHLAEALCHEHDVTLASSVACDREHPNMSVLHLAPPELQSTAEEMDVVIGPGSLVRRYPALADLDIPLVIDLYDPYHLENLAAGTSDDLTRQTQTLDHLNSVIAEDLARGDFFLSASARQRDFWLGSLATAGRVNPYTYRDDPLLHRLITVLPFGLPSHPPTRSGPGLRDHFDRIGPRDRVVVWGGGVYNWFDPISLVHAIDQARARIPDLRLVFLGMSHPNPDIPEMRVALETRAVASDLGLTDRSVFFNEGWVPYDQRANFLLDAQLGASISHDHIETRFSFRTRVLDYLWAGLPVLLTKGDTLADLVADAGAGAAVPAGDVDAMARSLVTLLEDPAAPEAVHRLAHRFRWELVVAPLTAFCLRPYRAPDLRALPGPEVDTTSAPAAPPAPTTRARQNLRSLASQGARYIAQRRHSAPAPEN